MCFSVVIFRLLKESIGLIIYYFIERAVSCVFYEFRNIFPFAEVEEILFNFMNNNKTHINSILLVYFLSSIFSNNKTRD